MGSCSGIVGCLALNGTPLLSVTIISVSRHRQTFPAIRAGGGQWRKLPWFREPLLKQIYKQTKPSLPGSWLIYFRKRLFF